MQCLHENKWHHCTYAKLIFIIIKKKKNQFAYFVNKHYEYFESLTYVINVIDAPEAPKKLTATDVTRSSITLAWEPPESDGGAAITGYALERKSPSSSRWVRVNKSPIRDTVYTVNDLEEGGEYEFRVMAENPVGISKPSASTGIITAKDPYGTCVVHKYVYSLQSVFT